MQALQATGSFLPHIKHRNPAFALHWVERSLPRCPDSL